MSFHDKRLEHSRHVLFAERMGIFKSSFPEYSPPPRYNLPPPPIQPIKIIPDEHVFNPTPIVNYLDPFHKPLTIEKKKDDIFKSLSIIKRDITGKILN